MKGTGSASRKIPAIALLLGLLLYAGAWWHTNPIGLQQDVQIAGITVPVPRGWTVKTFASQANPVEDVILDRAYIPFPFRSRPGMMASFSRGLRGGEPYTIESAQRDQAHMSAMYENTAYYSNPRTFELKAGKYTSLCAEATMRGNQLLNCAVVGTPLRFTLDSSKAVDPEAEKILASLN